MGNVVYAPRYGTVRTPTQRDHFPKMQETADRDEYGRRVIHRSWRNARGQLHRTTGPAVEEWTVLPDGAHMLSYQAWYVNGKLHREGQPARRGWHIADDGTRVLEDEEWYRHGNDHRMNGPSWRRWTARPDGTLRLEWKWWYANGKMHRADGPAIGRQFCWHGETVRQEDLPWLRRGRTYLTAWATRATGTWEGGGGTSPVWSRDARVTMPEGATQAKVTYRSAVGGAVLLCV